MDILLSKSRSPCIVAFSTHVVAKAITWMTANEALTTDYSRPPKDVAHVWPALSGDQILLAWAMALLSAVGAGFEDDAVVRHRIGNE